MGQGLVGTIAASARSLNLSDAQSHPAFTYLPEPGEDDEAEDQCAHEWVTSDPEEGGDGRCYCLNCGADGDG